LDGADELLLISANEVGKRAEQHLAVVKAAKKARVARLFYTSILRAGTSTLALAREHLATEDAIRSSGLRYVFLRNGWYIENYTERLAPALERGVLVGSAGTGRVAGATRADYAAAAVAVLTGAGLGKEIYELAGDEPFTMPQLAAEVSRQAGRTVVYQDLPQERYEAILLGAGLPRPLAALYADADAGVARGELDDSTGDLHRLIGRATTPLRVAVAAAFPKSPSLPRHSAA
jgi:NAD(P)H dehydrogenase (quinone)